MTTSPEQSWRARWKAIAKYYRALYFAPVTADCPQAGQRAQVTNFCANCEATERHSAALQAERDRAQAEIANWIKIIEYQERQIDDFPKERRALLEKLGEAIAKLEAARTALAKQNHEISQTLGRALGYPRFTDDQKNFPGATDADGVCVGEHVAETLASEAAGRIKTLTGAMAAQDGRERAAGALCGIPYEEHGCDWPDAVAERLVAVREQRDKAQADAAALRRFLIASIRQLGDPAFLITYQSGRQLVAEIRRAMAAQLEAPNPGESLLVELTAARTQFATLHAAVQQVIFTLNSRDEDAAALERALTALEQVAKQKSAKEESSR